MHLKSVRIHPNRYPAKDFYPFNAPSLQDGTPIFLATTCFVGQIGTGKSTLLEAIAALCNIHIWRNS
jgi:predicted ATPase